ncbi:hypothetical protein B0H13DRAFT_2357469 [Mycena leptocephala]|nr:hypothetical protein B0H13DRAFT_2357469 [Mycena leptocephala]
MVDGRLRKSQGDAGGACRCVCGDGVIPRGLECGVHMHELLPVVHDLVPASRHGYVAIECRRHDHGRTTVTRPIFWLLCFRFCFASSAATLLLLANPLRSGPTPPTDMNAMPPVPCHLSFRTRTHRTPSSDGRAPDSEQQRSQPTPFLPSMRACRGSQRGCPAARECPCPYGTIFGYTSEAQRGREGWGRMGVYWVTDDRAQLRLGHTESSLVRSASVNRMQNASLANGSKHS